MEHAPALIPAWTLLVDPAAAQSVIARVAKLDLPRRIYRSLDRRRAPVVDPALARFDADVEAANDAEATEFQGSSTTA